MSGYTAKSFSGLLFTEVIFLIDEDCILDLWKAGRLQFENVGYTGCLLGVIK